MSDSALARLLHALDLTAIERRRDGAFYLLTPAPDWLAHAFDMAIGSAPGRIDGGMPFLDHFLHQADAVWHEGPPAAASSGPFIATIKREEILINARAMTIQDRHLLVIERLTGTADTRPMLQKAREQLLEHEQLVRRIGAVQAPAAAVDRGIKQLLESALSPEQRAIVEAIDRASTDVQSKLATLPSPPRQHRRQVKKIRT
jgi:hypothetical protein